MEPLDYLLLIAAGFAGGMTNAIAGGATFFTFPAMLAVGIPPVAANASNTTALAPASLVAAWTQRHDLADVRPHILLLSLLGIAGGVLGAILLLVTPDDTFMVFVPFLLLLATALFALSPHLMAFARRHRPAAPTGLHLSVGTVALLMFCFVYGGYFGAGLGIMMLAGLALSGLDDLRVANGLKNGLSALVNGVAVVVFIVQGIVVWQAALVMLAGAVTGGFVGAKVASILPRQVFRAIVITVGSLLTVWYFLKL